MGAALAGSLSGARSVAVSYGNMLGHVPTTFHDPAFKLSSQIINHLVRNWGRADVLYSVNIPMVERLLHEDGLKIYWTSVWRSKYGRLFKEVPVLVENDTPWKAERITIQTVDANVPRGGGGNLQHAVEEEGLVFAFEPDLTRLPHPTSAPEGSDCWALAEGAVSVTPFLTSFAGLQGKEWKFVL